MSKTFSRRGSSVVVAIKFNDHAPTLIKWGLSIARRMGLPLVLVNVTEHHALYFVPYSLPILDILVSSVEAENQLIAESQLNNLAEKYLAGYEHKIYARSGYAAKEILEQAAYSRASLIIVGAAAASHHFVPKGFSTSLTLLAESPVPVLVISAAIETAMSSERCIVAFADDLSPRTESMARAALKFSASLGGVDFHHVHVNALTEEVLDASINSATAASHSQSASLSVKELVNQINLVLKQKMDARAQEKEILSTKNGTYASHLLHGEVQSQLLEFVRKVKPSIMMFGRHKTFHHRPFLIGHLPFYVMMDLHLPMIVLPEERY